MRWIGPILLIAVIAAAGSAHAVELHKGEDFSVHMKGYIEINAIHTDDDATMKDGSSRVGFRLDHSLKEEWNVGAYLEWGIRTTSSGRGLKISGDEQVSLSSGDPNDAISLRQGNVFLNLEEWGNIKVGKQWSVYYDAAGTTDVYNMYGGEASGTFNLSSDGGLSGTGRADNAITWRKSYGDLDIGLQGQLSPGDIDISGLDLPEGTDLGGEYDYGYGIALGYTFDLRSPLAVRAAYNYALVDLTGELEGNLVEDVDDEAWLVSVTLGKGMFRKGFHASVAYAQSQHHEFDTQGILYDAEGLETVIAYGFNDQFQIYVGNNQLKVDDPAYAGKIDGFVADNPEEDLLTDEHELSYYILGANYNWTDRFKLFVELRIDDSDFNGRDGDDVYGVGIRLRL
jgi:outer membrane protein N